MKVALIISGKLRNYGPGLLSLHIWGECDRYLVTWDDTDKILLDDYFRRADCKDCLLVTDNISELYQQQFQGNWIRMVTLWKNAFRWISPHYDRYVLLRPDGFYWSFDTSKIRNFVETIVGFAPHRADLLNRQVGDQLIIFDNRHIHLLSNALDNLIPVSINRIRNSVPLEIHSMLCDVWENDIDFDIHGIRSTGFSNIESDIVRDTFIDLPNDIYDFELYKAVFYDTAAYWRRQYGKGYANIKLPPF
jgi:hypothetical protein